MATAGGLGPYTRRQLRHQSPNAVYVEYFQLREMPFSITPDPAYLYLTPRHQEALGHLLYGTGQYGGFVQLTGEVGTGKTTIVRSLLEQKLPDVDVAMIHNPRQSEQEFVHSICDELGVQYPRDNPTLKMLVDALNAHLLRAHAAGRRTVLIIDEAQNLMPSVLEQVRLLTNLETAKEKLLRIMLVGQPELSALLARPDLRQLASRITARYHLTALTPAETREYVEHRLRIAGAVRPLFSAQSLQLVHNAAHGNPRLINIICDRALMGAYALREAQVTPQVLRTAAREALGEIDGDIRAPLRWRWIELSLVIALFACLAMFAYTYWPWRDTAPPAPAVAAATSVPQPSPAAPPVMAPPAAEPAASATPEPTAAATAMLDADVHPTDLAADLGAASQPLSTVLAQMVALWGADASSIDNKNLCEALKAQALECYRSSANWTDLRLMNRPAVLTLQVGDEGQRYFLLKSLDAERAVLLTALGPLSVPLSALDPLWNGEFLLLWRRDSQAIRIDSTTRGSDVQWLYAQLVALQYLPAIESVPERMNVPMSEAVRRLQSARGLQADGVAGVRTLIELGDSRPQTPVLAATGVAP